ncbi:MAG TPA: tetratricopeptide repeat protein [Gammaproteobacteria bacterium]|nr:tetratricopeptide repeat protein [Gammaproteobacteria bacterium]
MSKKGIVIAAAVALVALYGVHVYRHHRATSEPKPAATVITPGEHKASTAAAEAPAAKSHDQELVDQHSANLEAHKGDPANEYYQRGLAYTRMKQYRLAVEDFSNALKLVPKSPNVLYARALAYREESMLDNAVNDLNAAIDAQKGFADAYNTRGLIYVDQGNFSGAQDDYNNAILANPKFTDAYFNQGTLYMRLKKYDEAKASFTKAISASVPPNNATPDDLSSMKVKLMQAYINLATAELLLNDLPAALKDATYVVTNDPKNVQALRVRSQIYDRMGNSAAAVADTAAADGLGMQNMLDHKQ